MAGNIGFEYAFKTHQATRTREKSPYRILLLGDFAGRDVGNPVTSPTGIAQRPLHRVDIDAYDDLWRKIQPQVTVEVEGTTIEFMPRDLEDFHPDRLYRNLRVFADLREKRERLENTETADEALAEILSDAPADAGEEASPAGEPAASDDDMFERLLGKPASGKEGGGMKAAHADGLNALIARIVAPNVVHEHPQLQVVIDSVDEAISETMRGLLHHPGFQALEAAWRSLFEMVTGIETGEELQLQLMDVSRSELANALPAEGASLEDSELFGALVGRFRQSADDTPVSLMVGLYEFGTEPEDVSLLAGLGSAALHNGASFLAGARPETVGCASLGDHPDPKDWSDPAETNGLWKLLRENDVAKAVGLAMPRVLLRLPYGEATDEIDAFAFEEMPESRHDAYLWGNPAARIACLVAAGAGGGGGLPGSQLEIGELPAHIYDAGGERRMKPCAEVLMSERAAHTMLDRGIMPVVSYRDRNAASLIRLQSIALPPTALAGRMG